MAKNKKNEVDEVPVEQDKSYEELVDPDITGEAPERGQQPYVGQLGPDLVGDGRTNNVDNENEYNSDNVR